MRAIRRASSAALSGRRSRSPFILAASVVALALALGVGWQAGHAGGYVEWLFRFGLLFSLGFGGAVVWSMWRAPRRG